jgi:hypothetical protein
MLKVLAVNLCTLAFAMTYYGNKKKTYTFYKYRVGTNITSLHLLFFSLPSLTICLSQSSTLVQNPLVSSFPPPDGLPPCLPHPCCHFVSKGGLVSLARCGTRTCPVHLHILTWYGTGRSQLHWLDSSKITVAHSGGSYLEQLAGV